MKKLLILLFLICLKSYGMEETLLKQGDSFLQGTLSNSSLSLQEPDPTDLMKVEDTCARRSLRWAALDTSLQRFAYGLVLRHHEVFPRKRKCSCPICLSGGSFPVESPRGRKWVLFVDGFRQGAEFVIFRTIHIGVIALTLYQLSEYLNQKPLLPCQTRETQENLLAFLYASDKRALLSFFHGVLGKQNTLLSNLRYLLFTPLAWGLVKGGWNTRKSNLSSEEIEALLNQSHQPSFGKDVLRWLIPLHPINQQVLFLMKNYLWNPTLSARDLTSIEEHLERLIQEHGGYTPLNALAHLKDIAYGSSYYDVERLGGEQLLLNSPFASVLETRQQLKERAYKFLMDQASFKDRRRERSTIQAGMNALYAQYLLWSLGLPRNKGEFIVQTLFKGGKLYVTAKLIQSIIESFIEAYTCPLEPGVMVWTPMISDIYLSTVLWSVVLQ